MGNVDNTRHYRIDKSRMLDNVLGMSRQVGDAWNMAEGLRLVNGEKDGPVVICGMGGSAIGGLLLRDLIGRDAPVPIMLERGYTLPGFADERTTVVCVSYSGNTEEVLSLLGDALHRGCRIAAITSGGKLLEEAERNGIPLLRIPGGLPPRAALGYLFMPILRIVAECGIYRISGEEVASAVNTLEMLALQYSLDASPAENAAFQLAKKIYGRIPLIYSGNGLLAGAAYRWRCQFNENSKSMAFSNEFPELGHNEIMGWDGSKKMGEDIFLVVLRDPEDHGRVRKRIAVTCSLLEPLAGGFTVVESIGDRGSRGRLARLMSVIMLGDCASVYLAVEYGRDPTPIGMIEDVKKKLGTEEE